ncbi:hypothetical protein ACFCZ1_36335 [Streptomyces sp. NPDC056224]|uniref:hypothetical protein n=1 Tax=Streptomyces sp. NPDC056224 TaxID=3345750 RepID=UPI0035D6345B
MITARTGRLYEHGGNGGITVETMRFQVGAVARVVKDIIVRSRRARDLESVSDNGFGYDGYSEMVSLNEVSVTNAWAAVRSAAPRAHSPEKRESDDP